MKVCVTGATGFIGHHLVNRLRDEGHYVIGIDKEYSRFGECRANKLIICDLRNKGIYHHLQNIDELYQLAADMGGAGYLFTGEHDAEVMRNSAQINLNVVEACRLNGVKRVFFSSSACIYPRGEQLNNQMCGLSEDLAYPADPDSEYGWEKLFSERLYRAYAHNYDMIVRIARYHNIYGPEGTYDGGREKAPAALCRKVAQAPVDGEIEIWGDGEQTRSFLYIDDCIDATIKLMRSHCEEVLNIGSEEMVTINQLAKLAMAHANKLLRFRYVEGPQGVRGRNSENSLIRDKLGWEPQVPLWQGIERTYEWIAAQVNRPIDTLHSPAAHVLTGAE